MSLLYDNVPAMGPSGVGVAHLILEGDAASSDAAGEGGGGGGAKLAGRKAQRRDDGGEEGGGVRSGHQEDEAAAAVAAAAAEGPLDPTPVTWVFALLVFIKMVSVGSHGLVPGGSVDIAADLGTQLDDATGTTMSCSFMGGICGMALFPLWLQVGCLACAVWSGSTSRAVSFSLCGNPLRNR